ncbi:IGHMBP2 family helicase [Oceanotoga sp. DSM 15011]|uniref:IGHMBP2 family helicase n=1 Tax=Oceanotoga sp. DSM 15011 TaxID=2984951 RepID=UPI0021F4928E|nr:IGHMBP2 family helicase [Oceanotoga sp. DSM 15011]UYP00452.1 IGHMBP2 family helicase [Oceanotoga sp. DSM 15011]
MNLEDYIKIYKKSIELERKAEIERTLEEIKQLSPEKRELIGKTILNLDGKIDGYEVGGFTLIKYGRKKEIKTNISVGDEIIVSTNNPLKKNHQGTVVEIGKKYITIAFGTNVPDWIFRKVRIDLYFNDVIYKRMNKALEKLKKLSDKKITKMLNEKIEQKININQIDFFDKQLNEYQKLCVEKALSHETLYILHGPPGTGKTRTIIEIIKQEAKKGKKVLATAESNIAADNIAERLNDQFKITRLGHPARTSKKIKEKTIYNQLEMSETYKNAKKMREEMEYYIQIRNKYKKPTPSLRRGMHDEDIIKHAKNNKNFRGISSKVLKSMSNWIKENELIEDLYKNIKYMEEFAMKNIIEEADIIVTTNSGAGSEYLEKIKFDVNVIDEASQAKEPSCLIPLIKSEKVILTGDHKQLPPTIISKEAKDILEKTLFERLIKKYPDYSSILRIQYRMNKKIIEFSNENFYNGKLKTSELIKNIKVKNNSNNIISMPENVLIFINSENEETEKQKFGSNSKYNIYEINIINEIINELLKYHDEKEIGIITPYYDQVDILSEKYKNSNLEINTVDGFQGREKNIIIISMVRSNKDNQIGFLKDHRRLNVSLTRSRKKLIIIGDTNTLKNDEIYNNLINHIKNKGVYIDSWRDYLEII